MTNPNEERKDKATDRHFAKGTPNPTDQEFFDDPIINKPGGVPGVGEDAQAKRGTESGRGNRRPDAEMKDEIDKLLAWQKTIDVTGIQVDVQDGVVTLSGDVRSQYDKQLVENLTGNVFGLQGLHNRLKIVGAGTEDRK